MKTLAIHPKEWRKFCEEFTQLNKGSVMSVELVGFDGRKDEVAHDHLFQKITLDTTDACSDMMSITLGEEGERRINHLVIEPVHVRLKQKEEGQKILQIEAENGVTRVMFHSGKFPLMNFESEFAGWGRADEGKKNGSIPS